MLNIVVYIYLLYMYIRTYKEDPGGSVSYINVGS